MTTAGAQPYGIAQGPDGNIWFTEAGKNQIGKINPTTHVMKEFTIDGSGGDVGPARHCRHIPQGTWSRFSGTKYEHVLPGALPYGLISLGTKRGGA